MDKFVFRRHPMGAADANLQIGVVMFFGPYPAHVVEVHDGDTVLLDIDLGFDHLIAAKDWNGKTRLSCRINGINAPELRNPDGSGYVARDFARSLLPVGAIVRVTSYGWDKYGGRFDGSIEMPNGQDFGTEMISAGQATQVLT